ncbi:IS1380 family transposase [Calothrix sp. PCC 7507]|uniref:IS1380 family transposase n=1 Tax=Calothrix sp. PCC 7507 TaxID=99598 RepID=UPI00029EF379|nr:IS1380 family transposase [Calothrix sp. PCC 7507]AFY31111.1 transposase IS4 family protein [Calothrix sp. PCC 7507]AFY31444.1 transposase IS4 family protein [Calothrix sp. PCC 7507]AFY34295.1 transposase IS4 family protein [Calothrix sp. PCC 7507]
MTPNKTGCIPEQFQFESVKSCPVVVNFNGETVTSDAGVTLIAELDRKREITSRLAGCFKDYREQNRIEHSVSSLIAQRVYGLVMGYEDINDHETLRHDVMFALSVGKSITSGQEPVKMAGKSTLNRLEHCPEDVSNRAESRYHRIEHDAEAIEKLLVEIFLESFQKPPRQIVLDLDVTDDLVHGNQEKSFFNPYYKGYCYAPLYIFCGKHLLASKLRASNVDPAEEALPELQRVIKLIRERWSNVKILVRGDSAYSREDIMSWCESQIGVDYVFGLAQNSRLIQLSQSTKYRAFLEYSQKIETVVEFFETLFTPSDDLKKQATALVDSSVWYCSLDYKTFLSWSRNRRVVSKIEYSNEGVNTRFVVTSLPSKKVPPGRLYTQKYCPRGNIENCFKEQKLELKSDRTSTHTFAGNQLRLWFTSIAYILMNALREKCLAKTELQNAQVGTIRTKLLKLGAIITVSRRRVLIAISNAYPYKEIFATAYNYLSRLKCPG